MGILFHDGSRRLQDQFDSRRLADRLDAINTRAAFTESDKSFIESRILFFLATADAKGQPTLNHKGGAPGFVRVTGTDELAFPDYDGNGMFLSLGNINVNPQVGLLFLDFEKQRRLRVQGEARVLRDDPSLKEWAGAQLIVRVKATAIFPNCPRYIPKLQLVEQSMYTPQPGATPPEPAWKGFDEFKDVVPPRQPTKR